MFAQSVLGDNAAAITKLEDTQNTGWALYCSSTLMVAFTLLGVYGYVGKEIIEHSDCAVINDSFIAHWIVFSALWVMVIARSTLGFLIVPIIIGVNAYALFRSFYTAHAIWSAWHLCSAALSSSTFNFVAIFMLVVVWAIQMPTFAAWCWLLGSGRRMFAEWDD
jgi:hypothetical protein